MRKNLVYFIGLKHLNLIAQSCRIFLLAHFLGPIAYGTYATLILFQQYLSYLNLGIRESSVMSLARASQKNKKPIIDLSIYSSFAVSTLIFTLSIIIYIFSSNFDFILIGFAASISISYDVSVNILRDQNRIIRVAAGEFICSLALIAIILIERNQLEIHKIYITQIILTLLNLLSIIFIYYPFNYRNFIISDSINLALQGLPLSFISFLSLASGSLYVFLSGLTGSPIDKGNFALGNNISTIVLLGFNSIAWAMSSISFSGILNSDTKNDNEQKFHSTIVNILRLSWPISIVATVVACYIIPFLLPKYQNILIPSILLVSIQSFPITLYNEMNLLYATSRKWLVCIVLLFNNAVPIVSFFILDEKDIFFTIKIGLASSSIGYILLYLSANLNTKQFRFWNIFILLLPLLFCTYI